MDPADQGEYQVVEESIRAVYVQNGDELEFVDASKIEDVVRGKLTQKHKLSASDVQVHEIALKVRNDKGEWETAAAENFPKSGIKITMPYPKGTGKEGFQFYGQHLFAENINGYAAGTTEDLEITKEDGGISFVVHGLSPISIGWSDEEPEENADNSDAAIQAQSDRNDSQKTEADSGRKETRTKSPKTGDGSAVLLYVMLLLAAGTGIIYVKRTRFEGR